MYNNRALVPEFASHLARWVQGSDQVRRTEACQLDLWYGQGAGETLDVFPSARSDAPVLVFIHGGYWRSLDKSDHSFVAPVFTRAGACVVVPNYALCPGTAQQPVSVAHIALQMVEALAWTWRNISRFGGDPTRIVLAGHSAGGHLAAMLLACRWQRHAADLPPDLVPKAMSISGLFELESIRRTGFLQRDLRLTPAQVRKTSPAWFAAPASGVLVAVAGGDESAEFVRQNRLIRDAWGLNHFSVLESLTDPASRLHTLALDLLGLC